MHIIKLRLEISNGHSRSWPTYINVSMVSTILSSTLFRDSNTVITRNNEIVGKDGDTESKGLKSVSL
jgi:hypothetical protein